MSAWPETATDAQVRAKVQGAVTAHPKPGNLVLIGTVDGGAIYKRESDGKWWLLKSSATCE